MPSFLQTFISSILLILAFPGVVRSQSTLTGKVSDMETGESLPGATIFLPDLKTGTSTDQDGKYTLKNLPKTVLLVEVSYVGYKSITEKIDLKVTHEKDFRLSTSAIEAQEVVVTGNALSSDNSRSSISITPISKANLLTVPSTNIIDAISRVPGVSQITTGGEISKPVIRGLGYNHVVTLNEGIRQEGNQWGDEHGIEIDQFSVDRIEVLKGPASLFYGSDAMGGVINILEPIPAPLGVVRGEITTRFSTNERLWGGSGMLEGNQNGWIWRVRGTYKNAASYNTPAGYIYNSGFREDNYSGMLGLNKQWGYSHLHFSIFDTKIGMVSGERDSLTGAFLDNSGNPVTSSESASRSIAIPFQHVTHYLASSSSKMILGKHQILLDLGYQDNLRREFAASPDAPSLFLDLRTLTYNLRYTVVIRKIWEIVAGVSGMTQENRNRGTEFLVPDYFLQEMGGFAYGKASFERFTFNLGLRYDYRLIKGESLFSQGSQGGSNTADTIFSGFSHRVNAVSGSAGMTFRLNKIFNFKFNIGRGFRSPNIAELASNGIHEGTFSYEIGNPDLKSETSFQIDGEISANTKYMNAVFNGFYNLVNNYIYSRNIDGEKKYVDNTWYPVYRYVQGNSLLKGFEFELDIHPIEPLHFDNNVDYVWAENLSTGIPLPYIPALHTQHEIKWTFKTGKKSAFKMPYISTQAEIHFAQHRIDSFETPTPGYVLINAAIGTNLTVQKRLWTFFISGTNLTDQKYFDHQSRLKPLGIHNMGWNLLFGIVIPFKVYDVTNHANLSER